jgi:uncharacterized DUF497 family protein
MEILSEYFSGITTFQWDEGNSDKNWRKREVTRPEAEEVFFNRPLLVSGDQAHSAVEARYFALGVTDVGRLLSVVFTLRPPALRIISVRPMSRNERGIYGDAEET